MIDTFSCMLHCLIASLFHLLSSANPIQNSSIKLAEISNSVCYFDCPSADQLMIFLPDESKQTILPRGINTVHLHTQPRSPSRLLELGLRSLYGAQNFYEHICSNLPAGVLPNDIYQSLINGPVCRCGHTPCQTPLFTECHFVLLKK